MARDMVEKVRRRASQVAGLLFIAVVFFVETPLQKSLTYEFLGLPAILLVFTGVVGRLWCTVYIGGRKDNQLVTDGPYSLWRNPLYVFSFIAYTGILLATRVLSLALVGVVLFFVYYIWIIRAEERRLHQLFGADFAAYCERVKVIVPAFGNYSTRPAFETKSRYFQRAMADAAMFPVVLVVVEAIYRAKVLGMITPCLRLPF